jgi:hypothetical protein
MKSKKTSNKKEIKRCYNCIFGGIQFKIGKLTHLHCENKNKFEQEKFDNGEYSAWESLMKFSDSCELHEKKH